MSDEKNSRILQPNSKTWEKIPDYSDDPMFDLQMGIIIEEDYKLDPGDGIFLIHAMKHDHPVGKIFFRDNPVPVLACREAVNFGKFLGIIKREER